MRPPLMLEGVLYRDRVVVVVALLSVIALSWLWVALGAGMDMSAVEMTRMPRDMVMTPTIWTAGYAALMLSMWFVMMVAMMLPSATPMLLIFARVSQRTPIRCARLKHCRVAMRTKQRLAMDEPSSKWDDLVRDGGLLRVKSVDLTLGR